MSDLVATNCGCGEHNGNGCNMIIWLILLSCLCGNGNGSFFGNDGCGNDNCLLLILLLCCCGSGNRILLNFVRSCKLAANITMRASQSNEWLHIKRGRSLFLSNKNCFRHAKPPAGRQAVWPKKSPCFYDLFFRDFFSASLTFVLWNIFPASFF